MPLKSTTVRFDEATYAFIRDEARAAGISTAQFIREATLIRAVLRSAAREARGTAFEYVQLAREVERLSAVR